MPFSPAVKGCFVLVIEAYITHAPCVNTKECSKLQNPEFVFRVPRGAKQAGGMAIE